MRGHYVAAQGRLGLPRPAGRDRGREAARLHLARTTSSATASPSSTRKCRESVFEFLEDWNALTERIGFWVDLDDAYRTLDDDYVESVWWALKQMWEQGPALRGPQGRPLLPALRHRALLARGRAGLQGRRRPVGLRALPGRRAGAGPLRAGDALLVWTTTPWTLVSNAAVAVDPDLTYVRTDGDGAACSPRRSSSACSARAPRSPTASRARARRRRATSRRSPSSPPRSTAPKGHTVLPGDFVTADDGTGLVHTAIAFGEDDYRLGAEHGLTVVNPVRLDGTYDERIGPYAGRFVKDADADLVEDLRARGRLLRAERLRALLPALLALRDAAALLRQAVLVHPHLAAARPAAGRQRDRRLAPGAHQARALRRLAGEQRRLGALARALLGHAAAGLALRERPRGLRSARSPSSRRCRAQASTTRTGPTSTTSTFAVRASAASTMRRVPEVIDVWFDSGAMPFAQHHAPFENAGARSSRASPPTSSARRSTRRAAGSTRCSRSRRCCSTARRTRPSLCLGHILDAEGQKMSKSHGQHRRAVGGASTATAPTRSAGTSSPPSSRGTATGSRSRRSASACASSCCSCGTPTASTCSTRTSTASRATSRAEPARRPRPLGAVAPGGDRRGGDRAASTPTTRRRAGRAIAAFVDDLSNWYVRRSRRRFWDGDPAAFATLHTCLVTVSQLLAPFSPFVADEIYDNLDGAEPTVHLRDWPEAGAARRDARGGDGHRARDGAARPRRARAGQDQGPPAAARGGRGRRRRRARGDRAPRRTSCARSSTSSSCASSSQADELGSYEIKPNYRTLGPRFGKHDAAGRRRGRGARPRARRRARCATAARSASASTATTTSSAPTTCCSRCSRSRATSSSARARTRWRSSSSSTTSCAARACAREIVHAVQNARKAAGLRGRGPDRRSRSAATRSCSRPRASTRATIAGETLAVERRLRRRRRGRRRHDRGPPAGDLGLPRERLSRRRRQARRAGCGVRELRLGGEHGLELGLEALLGHARPGSARPPGRCGRGSSSGSRGSRSSAAVCWFSSMLSLTIRRSLALAGDLLEHGADDAARAAPGGPEVDEDGRVGLDDLGLEVAVGDFGDAAGHAVSSSGGSLQKV